MAVQSVSRIYEDAASDAGMIIVENEGGGFPVAAYMELGVGTGTLSVVDREQGLVTYREPGLVEHFKAQTLNLRQDEYTSLVRGQNAILVL